MRLHSTMSAVLSPVESVNPIRENLVTFLNLRPAKMTKPHEDVTKEHVLLLSPDFVPEACGNHNHNILFRRNTLLISVLQRDIFSDVSNNSLWATRWKCSMEPT